MKIVKNENKIFNMKTIKELDFKIKGGKRLPKGENLLDENTSYAYIRVTDIKNKKVNKKELKFLSEKVFNILKNYRTELNDLVISNVGTIGRTFTVNKETSGINLTENCLILRLKNDNINIKYIEYFLNSIYGEKELYKNTIKTAMPKLSIKNLEKIKITIPDYYQQNKIAQLLSEKEQHIENIKSLISKLEKRNEYYADKLLSGELRVREKENGEIEFYQNTEWKEVKLNNKIKLIPNDFNNIKFLELSKKHNEGGTPSTDNEKFYKNGNIKWATIKDIQENMFDTKIKITEEGLNNSSAKMWEIDTLILSTGATIGNVGIVKSPLCTKQGILGIKIKENNHYKYFYYLLKSYKSIFNRYAEGSTFLSLKKGTLEKIDFILPVTKEEQIVISDILDKFNKEKELLENLLEKETKEFEWLSEKLLSGEYIIED